MRITAVHPPRALLRALLVPGTTWTHAHVTSIVPFIFPFMVPMWTMPIALVMGNNMVLKPSEKVPMTMYRTMELLKEAGFLNDVVNGVKGGRDAVYYTIDNPLFR